MLWHGNAMAHIYAHTYILHIPNTITVYIVTILKSHISNVSVIQLRLAQTEVDFPVVFM